MAVKDTRVIEQNCRQPMRVDDSAPAQDCMRPLSILGLLMMSLCYIILSSGLLLTGPEMLKISLREAENLILAHAAEGTIPCPIFALSMDAAQSVSPVWLTVYYGTLFLLLITIVAFLQAVSLGQFSRRLTLTIVLGGVIGTIYLFCYMNFAEQNSHISDSRWLTDFHFAVAGRGSMTIVIGSVIVGILLEDGWRGLL